MESDSEPEEGSDSESTTFVPETYKERVLAFKERVGRNGNRRTKKEVQETVKEYEENKTCLEMKELGWDGCKKRYQKRFYFKEEDPIYVTSYSLSDARIVLSLYKEEKSTHQDKKRKREEKDNSLSNKRNRTK